MELRPGKYFSLENPTIFLRIAVGEEMKPLEPNETEVSGELIFDAENEKMIVSEGTKRIDWLKDNVLKRIGPSEASGGWRILYQDPGDGRYWELLYLQSELQGGGPPTLRLVSDSDAKASYNF